MTDRFFTNALSASGALAGTERVPFDVPAGGSKFLTPLQIEGYVEPLVIAATEVALLAARGPTCQYSTASNTTDFTATAGEVGLASNVATAPQLVVFNLTGALGAGGNLQLPTVASLVTLLANAYNGQTWILRVLNNSSGAFSWTLTTNTGWTLSGTVAVAQNTFRDFLITITDAVAHTASLQNIGSGDN